MIRFLHETKTDIVEIFAVITRNDLTYLDAHLATVKVTNRGHGNETDQHIAKAYRARRGSHVGPVALVFNTPLSLFLQGRSDGFRATVIADAHESNRTSYLPINLDVLQRARVKWLEDREEWNEISKRMKEEEAREKKKEKVDIWEGMDLTLSLRLSRDDGERGSKLVSQWIYQTDLDPDGSDFREWLDDHSEAIQLDVFDVGTKILTVTQIGLINGEKVVEIVADAVKRHLR